MVMSGISRRKCKHHILRHSHMNCRVVSWTALSKALSSTPLAGGNNLSGGEKLRLALSRFRPVTRVCGLGE